MTTERSPFRERAYRTLAAVAGAAVDVLRMRKTRKSGAGWAGGDNEIEMAKADHRIGLTGGGGEAGRARRERGG